MARAVAPGATLRQPIQDRFNGARSGKLIDPAGHAWRIATRREDVSPAEMQRRWDATLQR